MQLYQPTITGSLSVSGSINISGSITIAGGGTISGTASIATNAITASSADNFLVRNTLTAQTLVVQTITSSVLYSSGSNVFGNNVANTQIMTGSVTVTGSLAVVTNGTEFQVTNTGVKIGNILTDSHSITGSVSVSGSLSGSSAVFNGFLGINGSPGTAFPLEAYINSSTAYSSTSRGNVMRVYNSNASSNVFAGIELGGAGPSNDGLAGLNGVVTSAGSAALTFYTRDSNTFSEKMRITSGGSVGIGTNSPNVQGYSGKVLTLGSGSTAENAVEMYGGITGYDDVIGALDFKNSYATGDDKRIALVRGIRSGNDNSGGLQFYTRNSGTLTLGMTLNPNGKLDVANRGITLGSMPTGSVIQVVSYSNSTGFSTTSGADTDTGLNLAITPTSSTSKILIIVTAYVRATAGGGNAYTYSKLWRGAIGSGTLLVNGFAAFGNFNSSDIRGVDATSFLDAPATTSSTTYRFSLNSAYSGTAYMNSTTSPSTITLMEIAQ